MTREVAPETSLKVLQMGEPLMVWPTSSM
ncbi:predicted protein [Streptomyces iranensis]|uniref:Uncharacterized protein n=1 Tax=Streptomyces iranensis TaxID=576784 RepID=A0A060ZJB5_9ACTN|nr:predicted protein [Streptomyces iranensis]